MPQTMQIPLGAAIPLPSLNVVKSACLSFLDIILICYLFAYSLNFVSFSQPIPHSLHTLSEFMNRMELAMAHNGDNT